MRTVDPETWSQRLINNGPVHETRSRFGDSVSTDLETSLRQSFVYTARQCLNKGSFKTIAHLVDGNINAGERFIGVCSMLSVMVVAGCWLHAELSQLGEMRPLAVSVLTTQQHIADIRFPAIALCSTGIISRKALVKYVQYLVSQANGSSLSELPRGPPEPLSEREVMRSLARYGALLSLEHEHINLYFSNYIRAVEGGHNVTHIMTQVAPSCEDLLVRCRWRGETKDCSALFQPKLTPFGVCCVFNAHYEDSREDGGPQHLDRIGADSGMSLLVHINYSDYAYTLRNNIGVELVIFDPLEYPLRTAGVTSSHWLVPGMDAHVVLQAVVRGTSRAVRRHSIYTRGCRFRDEQSGSTSAASSYASCLLKCQRRSFRQLCRCVPYYFPRLPSDFVCTPSHLQCLNKHRELFNYYYPQVMLGPTTAAHEAALQEELQNSLYCPECVPDCCSVKYRTRSFLTTLSPPNYTNYQQFLSGVDQAKAHVSGVRVYYASDRQTRFTLVETRHWQQLLLEFVFPWLRLFGTSVVTAAEMLYFIVIRWRINLINYRRRILFGRRLIV